MCSDCYNPLNAKVKFLAKPQYPATARSVKVSGRVDVLIEIAPNGKIVSAKPISGNPLLWAAASKAALRSEFEPVFLGNIPVGGYGQITYNFVLDDWSDEEVKPIPIPIHQPPRKLGIVNGMASYLPKPIYPKRRNDTCVNGKVGVQVLIGTNGRVKNAKAISGNRFLRNAAVAAARRATFRWIVDAPPVERSGIVVYNFPRSRRCLTKRD